ncbi:MAG: ester cyclase [Acidobacteriaceae bacterium]|jgi:carboxymethylenebutenolidase
MNDAEMIAKWDEHISYEFSTRDVSSTIATMVEDAYVNHVPVMTGGYGHEALRKFYAEDFISLMPADTSIHLISRTLGHSQQGEAQLVDEMIFSFTHTEEMPWMLPGISPTHRHVDIPLVVVVGFRDGKLAHERIYWDQASVLKQIGLLTDPSLLPQRSARRTDSLLGRGGRRAPESACYYWAVFQSPNRCDPGCRTQKRWNRAV